MPSDELEEISGIKPKVWLPDGQEREVSSQSSNSVYKVKRTFDHYYCVFIKFHQQGGSPVNARTCKHLRALLGDDYELARVKMKNPDGPQPKHTTKRQIKSTSKSNPTATTSSTASSKRKTRAADDDEGLQADEEDDKPPTKRSKVAPSSSKGKGKKTNADDDAEDAEDQADDDENENAPVGKAVPELLLANKWDLEKGLDPTGWWLSEKLDGVRTFYDGNQLISRLGNPFTPPNWFLDKLPKGVTLDGELYGGRGNFQSTVSIVKTVNSVHWKNISFQIFDVPSRGHEPFEERYKFLQETFGVGGVHAADQICVVEHELAKSRQHVLDKLKEVEGLGGEGLMLRKPQSVYEGKRSGSLLKIKTFYDAEAIVTGHAPGKGRNKGITGALMCKMESGKLFNVGSGLTDKIRKEPPKIGSIITYRFQELTRDGVPRFPSYIGLAVDKDRPKDAEIPEHRKAGAAGGSA
ncbi:DNA ligase [Psilocybe cubensis]|uniref:DNA ligase n=2 Tax=Psilocybe cubensis TaxID=181762 RepID=A0ACB8H2G9_PSICU|nr:DNA ligase [Psilocybe cubensis]KAH9482076.1 DNA ligase [Psilocybe cubensis]